MPTIDLARRTLLAVLSLIVLAGCSAHGFDRGKLSQSLGEDEPRQITDQDIKSALARKPQLHFPFKLAVELQSANECQNCAHVPWREADKQKILAWGDQLKQAGVISQISILPDIFEMRNLKTIRLATAQQSADAVLIVRSVADTDSYSNYASILYLTIIGWWIVPGTDIDGLVIMRGAMYDVANAYLYLTAEAEGEAHLVGPTLGLRDRDAIDEAKAKALDNFGPEFVKHVEAIAPSSTAQASPQ